jgi:hypothetical protein
MVSKRLTTLFVLALGLIYLHGVEEVLTGFPRVDSFMKFGASFFNTSSENFYWISHIFLWWLPIPVIFLILRRRTIILPLLALFGLVFVFELHHLVKAALAQSYYPGMITAFFYPILGVFFYKELLRSRKAR